MHKIMLVFISVLLSLSSCKKNSPDEYIEPEIPALPDFSSRVTCGVKGFITDELGNPLAAASILVGDRSVVTDNYGFFSVTDVSLPKSAGLVSVTYPGYFKGFRTFIPREGKQDFIRLQLIPLNALAIDAQTGGEVTLVSGASVVLPANGVTTMTGLGYTGPVTVAFHWLDPSDMPTLLANMPGDLRAVDENGHLKALVTFGMMAIELSGSAGEPLQLKEGSTAELTFPIPSSLQGSAPQQMPLWHFDEVKGLWMEEGSAIRTGNSYKGNVSHFSFWNCDVPYPVVTFSAQLVDDSLRPLANIPVSISIAGEPNSARTSYTDQRGFLSGMVPGNSSLEMKILTSCTTINILNFSTATANKEMGTIVANLQQYGINIMGTVENCNGSPVMEGHIIIESTEGFNFTNIVNGSFHLSTIACPSTTVRVIATDNINNQHSTFTSNPLVTGNNDLGVIQVCGSVQLEEVVWDWDGVTGSYADPVYHFVTQYDIGSQRTTITVTSALNPVSLAFQIMFTGAQVPGVYLLDLPIGVQNDFYVTIGQNPVVVITEYGSTGEFISGNLNVVLLGEGGEHVPYSVSFRVRRDF